MSGSLEWAQRIQAMEPGGLLEYMRRRLAEDEVNPPLDTKSAEDPEYLLEKAYESGSAEFQGLFRRVVGIMLAREMSRSDLRHDLLARLFIVVERFDIDEAGKCVAGFVFSGELKGVDSSYGNLHSRALRALGHTAIGRRSRLVWADAAQDHRFTADAFVAPREIGIEAVLDNLASIAEQYARNPDSLDLRIALRTLLGTQPSEPFIGLVVRRIVRALQGRSEHVRDAALKALADTGIPSIAEHIRRATGEGQHESTDTGDDLVEAMANMLVAHHPDAQHDIARSSPLAKACYTAAIRLLSSGSAPRGQALLRKAALLGLEDKGLEEALAQTAGRISADRVRSLLTQTLAAGDAITPEGRLAAGTFRALARRDGNVSRERVWNQLSASLA